MSIAVEESTVWGIGDADVSACAERLASCGIWWRAVMNHDATEVYSCRHAVKFRERLGSGGNGGIPLWSELKSLVGIAVDEGAGTKVRFAAHTRANTRFSERLLLDALGLRGENARIRMVFHDETDGRDAAEVRSELTAEGDVAISGERWFGKVNPFNVDRVLADFTAEEVRLEDIPQMLDESLELDGGVPNTLMSNLGSRTAAFEVQSADLISAVKKLSPRSFMARVAEPCPVWLGLAGRHRRDYWLQFPPARGPKIGILTGNSPESGMTLWRDMLGALRSLYSYLPDALMPEVDVHSIPEMGLSMELTTREEAVREVVRRGVGELLNAGCAIVTLACNTTIYYEPLIAELCEARGARFVSIAEACMPAVQRALQRADSTNVGLVGIGPVVDMAGGFSGYKRYLEIGGIQVIPCPADRLAFAIKNQGPVAELVTEFRRLMQSGLPSGHVVVILALTEASMVYREHIAKAAKNRRSEKTFIDPLLELGKYLTFLYLRQGYKHCRACQIPEDFDVDGKLKKKLGWS
jgi:aspartate/glutamate racemase